MARWLRAGSALAEDQSLAPITHIKQLSTACNSQSLGTQCLGPPQAPAPTCMCHSLHTKLDKIRLKKSKISTKVHHHRLEVSISKHFDTMVYVRCIMKIILLAHFRFFIRATINIYIAQTYRVIRIWDNSLLEDSLLCLYREQDMVTDGQRERSRHTHLAIFL